MAKLNRRNFLGGLFSLGALSGCETLYPGRRPDLRLGVISDVHVMTPETTELFRRSLAYFRDRGVDAVVCTGDLTDWGLKSSLGYVKAAWDAEMSGTGIVPLFCTGNHDFEGFLYGDMTLEMHALGYDENEAIVRLPGGMRAAWESTFGEPWAPIRKRTVRGFDFVSAEYGHEKELAPWMAANGASLKGDRPFFFLTHMPLYGRDGKHSGGRGNPAAAALKGYGNAIALTGHVHVPLTNELSIRKYDALEISIPSLSYASMPSGHENGSGKRNPKEALEAMPIVPSRFDLRGGQGYVFSVYGDEMVVERRDLEEGVEGAAAWIVPLPSATDRSFEPSVRAATFPAPEFPTGAGVRIVTRNTERRNGSWTIVMHCTFPSATMPDGSRVYDYEIRAVPKDGSAPMVKHFISPAYAKLAKYEPKEQRFWFSVADLPQDREYSLEIRARNFFGAASAPIVSAPRRGKPGLDKVTK